MSDWSTGLFGCFEDFGGCVKTMICPCSTVASNRARFDERQVTCMDYCCATQGTNEFFFRQHIRAKYRMPIEDQCSDCMAVMFCGPCVVCQHSRELDRRSPQYSPMK